MVKMKISIEELLEKTEKVKCKNIKYRKINYQK